MSKTRKAKLPLSPERIVSAALALVQQDGLAGLSTRRLGQCLDCEAMSIYHHFPSKQHLLDALVDHAIASVDMPSADLTPVERLRAAGSWPALRQRGRKVAGALFVSPEPGPVLANYGLENLRFLTPVKPGDELTVTLTAKQITPRVDAGYGQVRWDTDVTNQRGQSVAKYDVLTLVAKE